MPTLQSLPLHLVGRILDELSSKERAQLALVSKTWRQASETYWGVLKLSFTTLAELELLRHWLATLAGKGFPGSVREFELFWKGGKLLHPASNTLHIEHFASLEFLRLKPPKSAYWALNSRSVERLAPLTNLKFLELAFIPSNAGRSSLVTLEEFVPFRKLRNLVLVIVPPKSPVTYRLRLATQLEGLSNLRNLAIYGLEVWEVTGTTRKILCQLTHLSVRARGGFCAEGASIGPLSGLITPELEAPNLQQLVFEASSARRFPFSRLGSLRQLSDGCSSLPQSFAAFAGLEKLVLCALVVVNEEVAKTLAPLQRLKEATFVRYIPEDGEVFDGIANLQSLERLTICLNADCQSVMCPAFSRLKRLKSLSLLGPVCGPVYLDTEFEDYKALEVLNVDCLVIPSPINSATLQRMSFCDNEDSEGDCLPEFGNLPNLTSLEYGFADIKDVEAMAMRLARLPDLRRLEIRKLMMSLFQLHSTFSYERLLFSLKRLKGLQLLKVTAVDDNVSLSRATFPEVQHFALACGGLSVCPSCVPWQSASMELLCHTASPATVDLLDHNADKSVEDFQGHRILRASFPWKSQETRAFDDDVFDQEQWQERVDETALS